MTTIYHILSFVLGFLVAFIPQIYDIHLTTNDLIMIGLIIIVIGLIGLLIMTLSYINGIKFK